MDYIAYSIHVSEVGGFYWYIIALQDLLRATEYTGASGVYAIRYYVNGQLSPDNHRSYCILDSLQVSSLCIVLYVGSGNEGPSFHSQSRRRPLLD